MKKSCTICHHAKTYKGKVHCEKGWWLPREYTLGSVTRERIPRLSALAKKCSDYSPPDKPYTEVVERGEENRRKIGRIIDAVRDKRKCWYYDIKQNTNKSYWEEWE